MAILDPRLLPLVEVLAKVGMDWLAFELVEGVRRGDESTEGRSTLRRARDRAKRTSDAVENTERFASPAGPATPLLSDDQLEWAAGYVDERLRAAFDHMARSLDALDEIIGGGEARPSGAPTVTTRLVLRNDDRAGTVGRVEIEGARARLSTLRGALDAWLLNERTGPQQ